MTALTQSQGTDEDAEFFSGTDCANFYYIFLHLTSALCDNVSYAIYVQIIFEKFLRTTWADSKPHAGSASMSMRHTC